MKRKSILLVDDEQLILDTLARELASDTLKFDISMAASGKEAIDRIHADSFDLVITDLIMPGLDGFQVLKAAKQKDPHTMVIVLTGYADLEAAVDALRLRADDFLQKPCDIDELLFRISNCFVKQGLQRQLTFYEKILPVCAYCRKIRDDRQAESSQGDWYALEEYLRTVKGANVSHGCCPECFEKQMADIARRKDK